MAFGTTPKDTGGVPIGTVYTPNVSNFPALEGSLSTYTDGSGNQSAPAAFHHAARTVLSIGSAARTATATNGPYTVGPFVELACDFNITAVSGTAPTLQFFIDRIGADNVAYNIWQSSVISTTSQSSASIGNGFSTNQSFGASIQLRWTITGTTPSFTFSGSIIGK